MSQAKNHDAENVEVTNGAAAAALLACGIGVVLFGVLVVIAHVRSDVADMLNLINPIGPLSGKVVGAIVGWLLSWVLLHYLFKNRQTWFGTISFFAFVLIVVGFAFTFPPVFELFGD